VPRLASFRRPSFRLRRSTPCSHRPPEHAPAVWRSRSWSATLRSVDVEHPDLEQDAAPIRVVLADDSVLLREGVASLLEGKGFKIVGQSGTAEDLLLKVRSYKPDVAIVDIKMPPTQTDEGLRAAKEIREKYPDTAVLVLSQYVEEGYALELLQGSAEGVGYLLKDRVYDLAD